MVLMDTCTVSYTKKLPLHIAGVEPRSGKMIQGFCLLGLVAWNVPLSARIEVKKPAGIPAPSKSLSMLVHSVLTIISTLPYSKVMLEDIALMRTFTSTIYI